LRHKFSASVLGSDARQLRACVMSGGVCNTQPCDRTAATAAA